jgi:murein hydrolase activator
MKGKRTLVFLLCLIGFAFSFFCFSQNTRENLLKKKKQLEEEIQYTNSLLEETRESKQTSLRRVQLLTSQIRKREKLIKTINDQLNEVDITIAVQNVQIGRLSKELDRQRAEYARLIYSAYKNLDGHSRLMFVFSSKDFNQAYQRIKYLQQYTEYRRRQAEQIQRTRRTLQTKQQELESTRVEKLQLAQSQVSQKTKLEKEKTEKDQAVQNLTQKEKQLVATLAAKQKAAQNLQSEIQKLIAEEIRKSEERAKKTPAKAGGVKKEAPKNGLLLTPVEKELSNSFATNKGRLPWPTEKGVITGTFGEHAHPVLKYVKVKNNGVDITTQKGAPIRAVFNGKVSRIMNLPGSNKVVIIRHGDYLSVYSNLGDVVIRDGQEVVTKQIIGHVMANPEDPKSELHFELWLGKTLQDPQEWLVDAN